MSRVLWRHCVWWQALAVSGMLEGKPLSFMGHSWGAGVAYDLCIFLKVSRRAMAVVGIGQGKQE
jgi:surfactin synthase thioesterase subunit